MSVRSNTNCSQQKHESGLDQRTDDLQSLSNEKLLLDLEGLFSQERKTTHQILLHLKEIRSRRLYAERGYPNLFSMLVQHFHQSESAANQRLKALELMLDVPVVEERLVSGDLSLSTVAMAQRQIRREERILGKKISREKKAEIVESITSKTMAQAEVELFKHLPKAACAPQTFERRISENATRMNMTFPDDVRLMMTRLQELWAHADPKMDPVEVIRRSFKLTLEKIDPAQRKPKQPNQPKLLKQPKESKLSNQRKQSKPTQGLTESAKHRVGKSDKRLTYYGKEFDRQLWEKARSQCEFVDPVSKRRCSCRFGLQREHVIPLGRGGTNELSNMQLLCSTHNLLRARRVFGNKTIDCHQKR